MIDRRLNHCDVPLEEKFIKMIGIKIKRGHCPMIRIATIKNNIDNKHTYTYTHVYK